MIAFHKYLEGDNTMMPLAWIVSRVCDEFSCLPSEAYRELMEDPAGMALEIIQLRNYARNKEILDSAKSSKDIPRGANIEQVLEIQAEIMKGDGQDGKHS